MPCQPSAFVVYYLQEKRTILYADCYTYNYLSGLSPTAAEEPLVIVDIMLVVAHQGETCGEGQNHGNRHGNRCHQKR